MAQMAHPTYVRQFIQKIYWIMYFAGADEIMWECQFVVPHAVYAKQ